MSSVAANAPWPRRSAGCVLTFVVPLRHPQNSADWGALKRRLVQTIRSIAGQDDDRWRAIIVANEGSDLPPLPANFAVRLVDFPPNPMFEQGNNDLAAFRDACRLDKGRRVLAGIREADRSGHVMVVDDDDFVSSRLTSFVAAHPGKSGWYVQDGYLWGDGGKLLYEYASRAHPTGGGDRQRKQIPGASSNAREDAHAARQRRVDGCARSFSPGLQPERAYKNATPTKP